MWDRRSELRITTIRQALRMRDTVRRRSILLPPAMALELENVHQHTQQHMNYIVDGLERRDRTLPGVARPDAARNLHEMEGAAAKHSEPVVGAVLFRKTTGSK